MSSLRWLELELSGFGLYEDVRIMFPPGLGVFVAPNEAGKSTAVAGLAAVIYGLPSNSDPSGWGSSKYRSYSAKTRFSGRVEFLARDGRRYEVRRDFESHEVAVRCLEPGREATLFDGKHNPGARKGSGQYETLLSELVGLTSAELFKQTFSIEQPLRTDEGLSHDVAGLLAGSGGGSHRDALQYLEEQISRRTRYTGDLGLPGRNKNKDRELQELKDKIWELKQAIVAGSDAADGLQRIQAELTERNSELEQLRKLAGQLELKETSAGEWLAAQEAYSREQRTLSDLSGKLRRAEELERRAEVLRLPSEEESREVERDWGFVEGVAGGFLKARREDAREVLGEFRLYSEAGESVEATRRQLARYATLARAPEAALGEIGAHEEVEKRLEAAAGQARMHLHELERHQVDHDPNRGFEDVAGLSEEQIAQLRLDARTKRGAGALATVVGAVVGAILGLLVAWAFQLDLPMLLLATLILALAGGAVPVVVTGRHKGERGLAAQRQLDRHERWRARVESVPPLPDFSPYQERVEQAAKELRSFRDRVEPYRQEYGDITSAYTDFEAQRRKLAAEEGAVARYARDFWSVAVDEVATADPLSAGGCWQRSGHFLSAIGYSAGTVNELVRSIERLDSEWDELARDAATWDARNSSRSKRELELSKIEAVLQGILDGEGVEGLDRLGEKVTAKQLDAVAERNRFKEVCDLNPELPRHDDPGDQAGNGPGGRRGEVVGARRRYAEESAELTQRMEALETQVHSLLRQRSEKEGAKPPNIAAMEIRLNELHEQQQELQFEVGAYALAYTAMSQASRDFQDEYLERLSDLTTRYFGEFTGRPRRQVTFQEEFGVQVVEEGGVVLDPSRLSQGAQDQLALAARLAIADMLGNDVQLPLVFDDPFQNCDEDRLSRIEESLRTIATRRQIVVLSHEKRFLAWGGPVIVFVSDDHNSAEQFDDSFESVHRGLD
ncbi:MAG: AAA family ATPase [Trueperaceae bacterium]